MGLQPIKDRDHVCHGFIYEGRILDGVQAEIVAGKSIRLAGVRERYVKGPDGKCVPALVPFDRTFMVGDACEYDSYNLKYTGRIVAIGAKSITVEDGGKRRRLTIYDFADRNWDFDAVEIAEHNENELQYI